MPNFTIDATYILSGAIFVIIWLVRLEALVLRTKENHDNHKEHVNKNDTAMWSKIETLQASLTQISLSLGRIEGKLENTNHHQ